LIAAFGLACVVYCHSIADYFTGKLSLNTVKARLLSYLINSSRQCTTISTMRFPPPGCLAVHEGFRLKPAVLSAGNNLKEL
jgi:hypothetical protein